jgi:hypothetical protein
MQVAGEGNVTHLRQALGTRESVPTQAESFREHKNAPLPVRSTLVKELRVHS